MYTCFRFICAQNCLNFLFPQLRTTFCWSVTLNPVKIPVKYTALECKVNKLKGFAHLFIYPQITKVRPYCTGFFQGCFPEPVNLHLNVFITTYYRFHLKCNYRGSCAQDF